MTTNTTHSVWRTRMYDSSEPRKERLSSCRQQEENPIIVLWRSVASFAHGPSETGAVELSGPVSSSCCLPAPRSHRMRPGFRMNESQQSHESSAANSRQFVLSSL